MNGEYVVVGTSREVIEKSKLVKIYREGGTRATAFMMRVVHCEEKRKDGRCWEFDGDLVKAVNAKVLFHAPREVRGRLREFDDVNTESDTDPVLPGRKVAERFNLFGRWLRERVALLTANLEDLELALRIGAEVHQGITGTELHPFPDGNKRTARTVMNGVLMLGTKELREFGIAVPPVPNLRWPDTERGRVDPYIEVMRQVRRTKVLNPFMKYIANKWADNLDERLEEIGKTVRKPTPGDRELIDKFCNRRDRLRQFSQREDARRNETYFVPIYEPEERYVVL